MLIGPSLYRDVVATAAGRLEYHRNMVRYLVQEREESNVGP
jgi:hypothetical protein